MAVCNPTWRTIVGLARYGGLRCPSEVLSLRWELVDWEHDRMVADSPKTEHHPGGEQRVVPIFPELRPILEEAFELAEPGAKFVVGGNYRAAAMGEKGWMNCNLRTQFERLIRRAGLTPWPRLLHNLRASRETELAAEFPLHVVTRWLGNTPRIAMKHYLQVTEDDFARAAGRATASPESPASDAKSAAPARNPATTEAPAREDASHANSPPTERHPGDREPAEPSGSQSGNLGRDPARDRNRPVQRAAECGAVALQNAVQSAHVGGCRELTAQSKTPVVTGVYADPDKRSQPLSKSKDGEDRIRTCGPHYRVTDLANPRFRPLSHLSGVLFCKDLRLLWGLGFARRAAVSYQSKTERTWLPPRGVGTGGSRAMCALSQSKEAHAGFYSKPGSPKSDYRPTRPYGASLLPFPL